MYGWMRPQRKPWFTKRQRRKRSPRCYTWTQTKYGWMRKTEWWKIEEAEDAIENATRLAFCQAFEIAIAAKRAAFTGCDDGNKQERRMRRRAAVGKLRRFESKNGYAFGDDVYFQSMCKKDEMDSWRFTLDDKFQEVMDKKDVLEKAAEDKIYQRQEKRVSEVRAREKANRTKTRLRNGDRDFKTSLI